MRSDTHVLLTIIFTILASHALSTNGQELTHCTGCIDGQPTSTCPNPDQCGYAPILCVNCVVGKSTSLCPNSTWCEGVDCSKAQQDCMDGMAMPGCPDPGTCNFAPIPCVGCVPGEYRTGCPDPTQCFQNMTTPPCMGCIQGQSTQYCPNATACLGSPSPGLQCINCMAGMAMPQCPDPDACPSCVMQMYFGADSSVCLFLQQWEISTGTEWFVAFLGILLLAVLREGLSVYRGHKHLALQQENNLRKLMRSTGQGKLQAGIGNRNSTASGQDGSGASSSSGPSSVPLRTKTTPLLSDKGSIAGSEQYDATRDTVDSPSSLSPSFRSGKNISLPPPESDFALHFFDSFYYFLSLTLGYLLMLVIMTYNVWLCLMTVGACGVCHFIFNYSYHTYWKRRYLQRMHQLVQEWQSANGVLSSGNQDGSGGVIIEARSKPTGGDHCCDDMNFDDI